MPKGDAFERKVRDKLICWGYFVVRAAGSKGPVDLVAVKVQGRAGSVPEVAFIQCKLSGQIGPGEWNRVLTLSRDCKADPIIAFRPKRGEIALMRMTAPRLPGDRRSEWGWVEWEP